MNQKSIPATFMRGGSSKGLFFDANDLPLDYKNRNKIFLEALGSPDIYGRQLNGMGGGLSSVSKVVIINKSIREDADIDYTFAQVAVRQPKIDYSTTCGNLSAAVGPFAIDSGIINAPKKNIPIRVFNTNLKHIFHAYIPTRNKMFEPNGNFSMCGVSGKGSKVCLDYINPGGTTTGKLFPTGKPTDILEVPDKGPFKVTMIDASAASVFISSQDFTLNNSEDIFELEQKDALMNTLEQIRRAAGVAMGISKTMNECPLGTPKICLISEPTDFKSLSGETILSKHFDISARFISMGQIHRVLPVTGAMSIAAASQITGTICNLLSKNSDEEINIGNPSGVLPVAAKVINQDNKWLIKNITVYRTARALMTGSVLIPK